MSQLPPPPSISTEEPILDMKNPFWTEEPMTEEPMTEEPTTEEPMTEQPYSSTTSSAWMVGPGSITAKVETEKDDSDGVQLHFYMSEKEDAKTSSKEDVKISTG